MALCGQAGVTPRHCTANSRDRRRAGGGRALAPVGVTARTTYAASRTTYAASRPTYAASRPTSPSLCGHPRHCVDIPVTVLTRHSSARTGRRHSTTLFHPLPSFPTAGPSNGHGRAPEEREGDESGVAPQLSSPRRRLRTTTEGARSPRKPGHARDVHKDTQGRRPYSAPRLSVP